MRFHLCCTSNLPYSRKLTVRMPEITKRKGRQGALRIKHGRDSRAFLFTYSQCVAGGDHPDRNKYYSINLRQKDFNSSDVAEITLMSRENYFSLYR